jgi:glycosyltransferase involved in cell wall biosynthesis
MAVKASMNVYYKPPFAARGVNRVVNALTLYHPDGIDFVDKPELADLQVLHVIGRHDHIVNAAKEIKARGGDYAVVQYVLKSCRNPDPADWKELWDGARVVMSYYPLPTNNLYHTPLGTDPKVFFKKGEDKSYIIGSVALEYKSECVGETRLAAFGLGKVLHIGEPFGEDPNVTYRRDLTDNEMRVAYNECQWMSVLRRKDGFEMIAVEALLCGARPIMFDTPNYRQWFDGLAEFIPESSVGDTVRALRSILKGKPRPVTDAEIEETKKRFDWERIVKGFWERCMI